MPTFDGNTLTITLDAGVTEVDVFEDLFEAWKDWLLSSTGSILNRRFPAAFRSDGGGPLSSVINQGGYIFLNNRAGWRIKPPEENITIYLTGNLAVESINLPAFKPTDGAFTAAVLGLQPVTQGVTPAMASQLEFNVFQGMVCVDLVDGFAGTGSNGLDPIGSRRAPSNNMADALLIAERLGISTLNFMSDATIASGDFSAGYTFRADSLLTSLTIAPAANVSKCEIRNLTIAGELDGLNRLITADVGAVSAVSGSISECELAATVGVGAPISLANCFSGIAGDGYPTLTGIGTSQIVCRNQRGSLGVAGMTGGDHSIGIYGGRLVIEADCTGGTIRVRGDPFEIADASGGAVTLVDQTDSLKVADIWRRLALDKANPLTNKSDGGISATGIDIVATPSGADIIQTRQ